MLDQSPVPHGTAPADALRDTIRLAQHTERLGYRRYWLAEHHNTASLAGTSPEILVAAVAGATSRIRVGSGGILLPYRSPLMVAEAFRVLSSLFPGRIDLGVGRAAGTDPETEELLRRGPVADAEEGFPARVADLVGYLGSGTSADVGSGGGDSGGGSGGAPPVWVLGSSSQSSGCAAYLGLAFSFAHFISPTYGPQIVNAYRRGFVASDVLGEPQVNVAVAVVCADTDEDARRVASTADLWRLGPEGTGRGPILPAEAAEAAAAKLGSLERERLAQAKSKVIVGAPDKVRAKLMILADEFAVDELMVLTVCHDGAARRRSYELLAEAFDLGARM